eukprot:2064486-Amphidinium_carterae.1
MRSFLEFIVKIVETLDLRTSCYCGGHISLRMAAPEKRRFVEICKAINGGPGYVKSVWMH